MQVSSLVLFTNCFVRVRVTQKCFRFSFAKYTNVNMVEKQPHPGAKPFY